MAAVKCFLQCTFNSHAIKTEAARLSTKDLLFT